MIPPVPFRAHWDGDMATFHDFSKHINSHFLSNKGSYLFHQPLIQAYLKDGLDCIENFPQAPSNQDQVQQDLASLYGSILAACSGSTADCQLLEHEASMDGIHLWLLAGSGEKV